MVVPHAGQQPEPGPWSSPPAPAADAAAVPVSVGWLQPMGLFGLSAWNYVVRILTLGVYHFWGKTEVRQRIWSAVRIAGEPLVYTGSGRELFLGFMIVFGVVMLPLALASFAAVVAFGPRSAPMVVFQVASYALFYLLLGVAGYRAQRYRLSRTRWRGIRSALVGSAWRYAMTHFWTGLLILPTLGWIIPWRATRLQRMLISDMRFGNQPFTFDATSRPLYLRFALLWSGIVAILVIAATLAAGILHRDLLAADVRRPRALWLSTDAIVALALVAVAAYLIYAVISAWYRASQLNHFAAHTHIAGARFRADASAGGLIGLTLGNFFLIVLSLGLLTPFAQVRSARYFVEHLAIDGAISLGGIAQAADQGISKGEGLAQAFDVDAF